MNFRYKKDADWYLSSSDLSKLNLCYRTWAALMRSGVDSIEKLSKMSVENLLELKNIGNKMVVEIEEALRKYEGV